jgi:hypothetical protein
LEAFDLTKKMSLSNFEQNFFDINLVGDDFYRVLEPHVNLTFFGAGSVKQLFENERKKQFLVDRPRMKRRRKRDKKGGNK